MTRLAIAVALLLAGSRVLAAPLTLPATIDDASVARLAGAVLATYRDPDRATELDNRFRLQLAAGRPRDAAAALVQLQATRLAAGLSITDLVRFEIEARAELDTRDTYELAYRRAFDDAAGRLDDLAAFQALASLDVPAAVFDDDVHAAVTHARASPALTTADALAVIRAYQIAQLQRRWQPLAVPRLAADDARRYVIDRDVLVKTRDGASVAAIVYRPRTAPKTTALLLFTIYARDDWTTSEARRTAAHGYAGVVAYTRGKGRSPGPPVPYEHDGSDADAVIEWIAAQPWSDGRVGMYGGSYTGFTQWAAAKKLPRALEAIMPSMTAAPGIDVPMEGNVPLSFVYPWPLYVATGPALDEDRYNDHAHWDRLNRSWYTSGQSYRSLDRIDGAPNPIFRKWLDHPSYDAYWQAMIPDSRELAKLDIPVLTTTGYYDGAQIGALSYFLEHHKDNARADHILLIGPYEHLTGQRRVADVLTNYPIDPVAQIDIRNVRYAWFDFVFKHAPKPALLADTVNYEVMGANVWKHAPSLAAMANGQLHFYLHGTELATTADAHAHVTQRIDFADRSDVDYTPAADIITKQPDAHDGLVFASEPMAQATEVSGLFSGTLDFVANKRDFDVTLTLYEQLPNGDYFQLSTWLARASYVQDRRKRHLLTPGKRQRLTFTAGRTTSRQLVAGSRLVFVLAIPKQRDQEINYGTGRDVADETIADAKQPLEIEWYGDSAIDVPIWR